MSKKQYYAPDASETSLQMHALICQSGSDFTTSPLDSFTEGDDFSYEF